MFSEIPPYLTVLMWIAMAVALVDGVALSRGAAWAYRLGIPLRWRRETIAMPMPREAIDLGDRLDREHSFETDYGNSAFYIDRDVLGLLYWKVSFGARNSHLIKALRGVGVAASGVVKIERQPNRTLLFWRPVLRLPPLLLLGTLFAMAHAAMPDLATFPVPYVMWSALYLGVLLWTLYRLPSLYESVSAQLVARAAERRR